MPEVVIADTSCLILLSNINELELLHRVYGDITTTTTIADEYGQDLPSWIKIKSPFDLVKQQLLAIQVDNGEASAIALALEIPDSLLILDDLQGRKLARQLTSR